MICSLVLGHQDDSCSIDGVQNSLSTLSISKFKTDPMSGFAKTGLQPDSLVSRIA